MPGESLELEVLSEKLYTEYLRKTQLAGRGKSPLEMAGTLMLHLKKTAPGRGWAYAGGIDPGINRAADN